MAKRTKQSIQLVRDMREFNDKLIAALSWFNGLLKLREETAEADYFDRDPVSTGGTEWFHEAQLARLKGMSRQWLNRNRWALLRGGEDCKVFGGKKRWHRSFVEPWLDQQDDELFRLYGDKQRGRKER